MPFLRSSSLRALRSPLLRHTPRTTAQTSSIRPFSVSQLSRLPQKDTQDKDSLKPVSSEYSKTGGGDQDAAHEQAAFDPNTTRPEGEVGEAEGEKGKDNPLAVSPGDKETNQTADPQAGGAQGSKGETSQQKSERERTSKEGSPTKSGKGQ